MPSRRCNEPPKCPLLALPREIRDEFHRYVQVGQRIKPHFLQWKVDAFKLLGECKSLRTLKIGVEQDTMSGSKKPKLDLMTARGVSTLRKIRGMEDVVVDVVEIPIPPRPDYMFPYRRSSDVPSSGPYFKPEMVQKFTRMLTQEMNWEEETPEQDQIQDVQLEEEEAMQSEPKSKSRKPVQDSTTRNLRSSKIQKSTSTPKRKVTKQAKMGGKGN